MTGNMCVLSLGSFAIARLTEMIGEGEAARIVNAIAGAVFLVSACILPFAAVWDIIS